jgi:monoamine oxidase
MLDDVADFLDDMTEEEVNKASFGVLLDRSFEMRKNGPAAYKAAMKAAEAAKKGSSTEEKLEEDAVEDAVVAVAPAVVTEVVVPEEGKEVTTADGDAAAAPAAAAAVPVEKEKVEGTLQIEEDAGPAAAPPTDSAAAIKEEDKPAEAKQQEEDDDDDEAGKVPLPDVLSDVHLQFLNWHWANLEYGCSAPLSALSAKNWNQDEDYGGFGGPHCMVVGGYDQAFKQLASLLDVRLGTPVASVKVRDGLESVEVVTESGESFWCDAVVVTVPLGVLKAGTIAFEPALPSWKQEAIHRLGFGDLNKVILQFPEVFWDDSVDFFGAAKGASAVDRGFCFMWWNFHRFAKAPILAALVSGESATAAETTSDEELKAGAMDVLRALHPGVEVPEPVACTVSRWASEKYTRGSYSYVAVGADGTDYDKLAIPVSRRILFAGEHTIKEHPDTVGGAMLSGLREAARAIEILENDKREGARGAKEVGQAVAELKRKHASERGELGADGLPASKKSKKSKKKQGKNGDVHMDGGDDDEEEGSEDEDDRELRYAGMMGRDVARRDGEMLARERSRAATKEVWRCLMAAEMNDMLPLLEIMDSSRDLHSRHTVSNCLVSASVNALQKIGADEACVKELAGWVTDSAGESSLVALLDQILKALRAMPIETALAQKTGLAHAVKRCTMHGDPDVRKLAGYLQKQWNIGGDGAGGGGGNGFADNNNNNNNNNRSGSPTKQPGAGNGAHPRVTVTKVAPPKIELDEDTKRQMAEAEAEVQKLEAAAAALAAEAAEAEAEAQMILQKVRVKSFTQFKEDQKKKPKTKIPRSSASNGGGGSSSGGGGNGVAAMEMDGEGEFNFKHKLDALFSSRLRPHLESRAIDKDAYKQILNKASEKVMSRVTAEDLAQGRAYYDKRKNKFIELVDAYIKSYRK